MELQDYSTETLINYLKKERGVDITQKSFIKLKPYFGEVKDNISVGIDKWKGHFGFTRHGDLTLCTENGEKIVDGHFLTICEDGVIQRNKHFRGDTCIKTDKWGILINSY